MSKQSLFRKLTNKELSKVSLTGSILDLGGDTNSSYQKLLKGEHTIITVNMSADAKPDILFDLEEGKLPVDGSSFNAVLAINVLEHIYNYNHLLEESYRVLKSNGKFIAVVPFLYYIHPSPNDYFRYTKQALKRMLAENNFAEIEVIEIGNGAFSVSHNLIHRFFPSVINILFEKMAVGIDTLFRALAARTGKKYSGSEYPLGYLVKATKP